MITEDPGFSVAGGEPGQISQAAAWHQELADAFELHQATISGAASSVLATWDGEAARSYGQLSSVVAAHFGNAAAQSRGAATALQRYATELQRTQREGAIALVETEHWLIEQTQWQTKLDAANRAITAAQGEIATARTTLSNPLMTGPFSPTTQSAAQAQLSVAQAALRQAQEDQRTAQRRLRDAEQQALLWQGRGRRAWDDAMTAAQQATGSVDAIEITPPPLAGWAVADRFNTPAAPATHHGGGGFFSDPLGTLEHLAKSGLDDAGHGIGWAWDHAPDALAEVPKLALDGASNAISSSIPGLILSGVSGLTGKTVGICVGGSASDGWNATGSLCYDATPSGQSGITVTAGGGLGGPPGIGASVGPVISNGKTLSDQGGPFTYGGGSVGEGPDSGGVSVSVGHNHQHKLIWDANPGWTPNVGVAPVGVHAGTSNTWTYPSN